MYDIRRVKDGYSEIHSRYYADTEGSVYSSYGPNCFRIMSKEGKRESCIPLKRKMLKKMSNDNLMILKFESSDNYFLIQDGSILKRLSTRIKKDSGRIDISLNKVVCRDKGDRFLLSIIIASTFLGHSKGEDVHHKDFNKLNNKLENLEFLTKEKHILKHREFRDYRKSTQG